MSWKILVLMLIWPKIFQNSTLLSESPSCKECGKCGMHGCILSSNLQTLLSLTLSSPTNASWNFEVFVTTMPVIWQPFLLSSLKLVFLIFWHYAQCWLPQTFSSDLWCYHSVQVIYQILHVTNEWLLLHCTGCDSTASLLSPAVPLSVNGQFYFGEPGTQKLLRLLRQHVHLFYAILL